LDFIGIIFAREAKSVCLPLRYTPASSHFRHFFSEKPVDMKNLLRFITVIFAAITLSALMAHLLELPGKMKLSKENYLATQGIYRGWSWLGIFEIGAILFTLIWVFADSNKRRTVRYLLIALGLFIISIVLFFIFTFPANTATLNWTTLPDNWETLQKNWEYSHAVRAILNFTGFCFLIAALLRERRTGFR
jgi:Domain of unknown function (DUF1772)